VDEQQEWKKPGQGTEEEKDNGKEEELSVDRLVIYRQIIEILKPGEDVPKVCGEGIGVAKEARSSSFHL
jgi:hypothetical protein